MTGRPGANGLAAGFSYVEVLVAVVLLAVTLAPALDALRGSMEAGAIHQSAAERRFYLTGLLETVLARPFVELDGEALAVADPTAATSYSDGAGAGNRRLVYLARYDGDDADGDADPFSGGDDGLLWVRVAFEDGGLALETLTAR